MEYRWRGRLGNHQSGIAAHANINKELLSGCPLLSFPDI
jgi:hypothetical protein